MKMEDGTSNLNCKGRQGLLSQISLFRNTVIISCVVSTIIAINIVAATLYLVGRIGLPFPILGIVAFLACFGVLFWIFLKRRRGQGRVCDSRANDENNVRILDPFLRVSQHDLVQATANFSDTKIIGRGRFGAVYRGVLSNGRTVAIKRMELTDDILSQKHFFSELRILGQLRHRNLMRILSFFFNGNEMIIIFKFMPNLSLDILLHGPAECRLDWRQRLNIAVGVAHGLAYLHHECRNTIVHCDLKPSNILLDENLEARIADFGVAKVINDKDVTESSFGPRFTAGYAAPERAYEVRPSSKSDIYSFGIVLLELITGVNPTSSRLGEGVTLYQWVKKAVMENGLLMDVLDDYLKDDFEEFHNEILKSAWIAMLCAHESPRTRPLMKDVAKALVEIKDERRDGQFNIPLYVLAEQEQPQQDSPPRQADSSSTSASTSSTVEIPN
eukprot:Gb_08218 [translate_table: standard]